MAGNHAAIEQKLGCEKMAGEKSVSKVLAQYIFNSHCR